MVRQLEPGDPGRNPRRTDMKGNREDVAGGIARFGLGRAERGVEAAGGVLRFNVGARRASCQERRMTWEALMRWETEGGASRTTTDDALASRDAAASGLDQATTDRVTGQLDPVPHAELDEDVLAVALDGLDADEERARDL